MADLEDLGLVKAPHTSAGRIPTVQGYRLFVDSMVTFKEPTSGELRQFAQEMGGKEDVQALLTNTSTVLSEVTKLAGVVMIPIIERRELRQVEFLPLNDNRVLVILVTNDHEVENRVIKANRVYSPSELTQAANYLTSAFAGKDIEAVKADLVREMVATREELDRLMEVVIDMSQKVFVEKASAKDYVLAGANQPDGHQRALRY